MFPDFKKVKNHWHRLSKDIDRVLFATIRAPALLQEHVNVRSRLIMIDWVSSRRDVSSVTTPDNGISRREARVSRTRVTRTLCGLSLLSRKLLHGRFFPPEAQGRAKAFDFSSNRGFLHPETKREREKETFKRWLVR